MSDSNDKFTILAVDDTPENLDVVKGILSPEYIVKAAINGPMALKIAEKQPPDLILEPPRVYRRLHFLRGWSYEQVNEIFPGSAGTVGTHGFRTPARIFLAVVGDVFHSEEDRLYAGDSA